MINSTRKILRSAAAIAMAAAILMVEAREASAAYSATTQAATSITAQSALINMTSYADPGDVSDYYYRSFIMATDADMLNIWPDPNYQWVGCISHYIGASSLTGVLGATVSHSFSMTGLVPGSTYYYRAVMYAGGGICAAGSVVSFTTSWAPPILTTGAASSIGSTTADLTGSIHPMNSPTTYYFQFGTSPSFGSSTSFLGPINGMSTQTVSATISALQPNTLYYARLVGMNQGGTSIGSTVQFTTAAAPPVVSTNTPTSITLTSADLAGSVLPMNSPTTYYFQYGTSPSFGNSTAVLGPINGMSTQTVSATVSNLQPNTLFYARLVATNPAGTSTGSTVTFQTSNYATPTATTNPASSVGYTGATLSGSVDLNGAPSGTASFEYGSSAALGVSTTPVSITGSGAIPVAAAIGSLAQGQAYFFKCKVQTAGGASEGSVQSFTTSVAPPDLPIANTLDPTSVTSASAQLNGNYDARGQASTVWFEHGTTAALGSTTTAQGGATGEGTLSTSISGLSSNSTLYYRLVCQTTSGRAEGSIVNFSTTSLPTDTLFQEGSFTYKGTWKSVANTKHNGGAAMYSEKKKSSATLTFVGTGFTLYGPKDKNSGYAKITVDGVSVSATAKKNKDKGVNLYSKTTLYNQPIASKTGLANGAHTIKINVTGSKDTKATKARVTIDAITVTPGAAADVMNVPEQSYDIYPYAVVADAANFHLYIRAAIHAIGYDIGYLHRQPVTLRVRLALTPAHTNGPILGTINSYFRAVGNQAVAAAIGQFDHDPVLQGAYHYVRVEVDPENRYPAEILETNNAMVSPIR